MKFAALLLALASSSALAQKASLTEQKACYEQAQRYLADNNAVNQRMKPPVQYVFLQAHYDSKEETCYVESSSDFSSSGMWIVVEDAFEGKAIAKCFFALDLTEKPPDCQVNGENAESVAVFDSMLWKLIPAFRPVTQEKAK